MRIVAFHQADSDPNRLHKGADRYYVGERFCTDRFVHRFDSFLAQAKQADGPVWLSTPAPIRECEMDRIVELVLSARDHFEGIQFGDLGLGHRLRGKARLAYWGYITNKDGASRMVDMLGVELIRPFVPSIDCIEAIGDVVPVEAVIHGLIPLSSTPRCLIKAYQGCEQCGSVHRVDGGPVPLFLKGNALFSWLPVQSFGLIKTLDQLGMSMGVIEGLELSQPELTRLIQIYKREIPPPNLKSSGFFFHSPAFGTDPAPWMKLIDAAQRDALLLRLKNYLR